MGVRRPLIVGAVGICVASALSVLLVGWSASSPIKLLQTVGVALLGAGLLFWLFGIVAMRMTDYREPADEEAFNEVERRAEWLAEQGLVVDPDENDFLALDPFNDKDFEELVRDALDELPDLLQKALAGNVAVVISDDGRKYGAYGLYQGDGAAHDDYADKVLIFRDTLRRDFGRDPDLLREQVTRTVRHELAHHVGFDEMGVQGLGL